MSTSNMHHIAQPFMLDRLTQCTGAGVHFNAIGDDALVSLVDSVDGVPGTTILGQARVTAAGATGMRRAYWAPVQLTAGAEYAIIVTAADADTSVGIGQIGAHDPGTDQYMGEPPYQLAPLAVRSDGGAGWTAKPDTRLTFELLEAVYPAASEPIDLGTVDLENATDLAIRADIESPEPGASCAFTLALDDGRTYTVDAEQRIELPERYTGNVAVTATLRRGQRLAPTLHPGAVLVHGHLGDDGTYISPSVSATGGTALRVEFDALLPPGSAVQVHAQADGGAWQPVPYIGSSPATTGVLALVYGHDSLSADSVRVRLTLTGSTTARPLLTNLRIVVI